LRRGAVPIVEAIPSRADDRVGRSGASCVGSPIGAAVPSRRIVMPIDEGTTDQSFVLAVQHLLGRPLDARDEALAISLRGEKSAEIVARELQASVVADPKKIRPEHSDTANE